MNSVYEAAQKLAAELKAELTSIQTYLDLHDHFSERFGLKSAEPTASDADLPKAEAPVASVGADRLELHDDEPVAQTKVADDDEAPKLEASQSAADEPEALEVEALDRDEPVHVEAKDEEAKDDTGAEEKPLVIKASEGVLIAVTAEAEPVAPLGPAATLQSVAEKLAATINASHPSTAG